MGILSRTLKGLGLKKEKTILFETPETVEFSARNQDGRAVKLSDFKGKFVLLYFYPKDHTPGCTKQACGLRDGFKDFEQEGAVVLGVSKDDQGQHRDFKNKFKLPFDLLVDEDGSLASKFQISTMPLIGWHKRESVLIGKNGQVLRKYVNVDPDKHAETVLQDIRNL